MQIKISSIIVKQRIRKDLGDIDALVNSMRKYGQLSPIIINRKNELIAGERRLEAAKRLNWQTINAIVVDKSSEVEKLEIEIEENVQRKKLSDEEVAAGILRLEKLRKPSILKRVINFIKRFFLMLFKPFIGIY